MRKHAAANDAIRPVGADDADVLKAATAEWQQGLEIGADNGWRNAQASVLAPTGTIGFMMDCDTTGIEPDFSLVKFKKLVGGGSMQIVNQTVPRALKSLGYQDEQIEAIVEFIAEHGHVVNAPTLRPEHYEVFDCAMGERAISPMGHVRMMAAVQPFISGAISKTVNMPETATVEDVANIYFQGWKLGLKALAIYRDNCKVGQPLSGGKGKNDGTKEEAPVEALPRALAHPVRKRLPKKRTSVTTSFSVAGAEGYMTAGMYEDGSLGEVFLKLGKQGSTLAGVMDAFSIGISLALQHGVPLETYISKFTNMRFEPAGMTDDPDIRIAQSVMDYIFRRLALDHLSVDKRAGLASSPPRSGPPRLPVPTAPRPRPPRSPRRRTSTWSSSAAPRRSRPPRWRRRSPRRARSRSRRRTPRPSSSSWSPDRHRRAALHDLRHEDAPGRQLLRLRGLRLHQRLQLM
jgi:ribonucleoside-diphosphate reductase alpha chain